MSDPPRQSPPADRQLVASRMGELKRARDRLHAGRQSRVSRWEEQELRTAVILALERYAEAITASGAPLSYRLRDELELYRQLGERT